MDETLAMDENKHKILIAEDEPMMLKVLEYKLRKDGYIVFTAADGREASAKLKLEKPDLVITDLTMPFISGLELVSIIKKNGEIKIPVIVLTDVDSENIVMEAFQLGADDFMTKPFSPNELSIRVKKLLRNN